MTATREQLASVRLFRSLSEAAVDRLAKIAVPRSFRPGEEIVREGGMGAGFFVITDGRVEVTSGGTRISILGKGDFFGEMAMVESHPRAATVRALEDVGCLALARWDFLAEVKSSPELAIEMLEMMSGRIRELDGRVRELEERLGGVAG